MAMAMAVRRSRRSGGGWGCVPRCCASGDWERGWSGYKNASSTSAPARRRVDAGRKRRQDEGVEERRRRGGGGGGGGVAGYEDRKGEEQEVVVGGRAKGGSKREDIWRRQRSGFEALGLSGSTARALEIEGLGRPTRIQAMAFEHIVEGHSVVVLAETGSGKTYAYALPLLARFARRRRRMRGGVSCKVSPAVLVLVPTEELATQAGLMMSKAAAWAAPDILVSVLTGKSKKLLQPRRETAKLLGSAAPRRRKDGRSEDVERGRRALEGSHVIVATPTWALRLVESGYMIADRLQAVVLDEADEMLSAGFQEAVLRLTKTLIGAAATSAKRQKAELGGVQVVLAAATMPRSLASGLEAMLGAEFARVASSGLHRVPRGLGHEFVRVVDADVEGGAEGGGDEAGAAPDVEADAPPTRLAALSRILETAVRRQKEQVLVFANSPEECDAVAAHVGALGFSVRSFHGRGKRGAGILDSFSLGGVSVLVSTDVAARGIDFPLLRYVVEYRPAASVRMHVHRIGRTARAGQRGPFFAVTLFSDAAGDEASRVDGFRAWSAAAAADADADAAHRDDGRGERGDAVGREVTESANT